jgi:transcriptional regulator with XRE-family HTH domain
MSVGLKINEIRRKRGFSLQELADEVGVSKGYIWELEKGTRDNPSLQVLEKLSSALKVPIRELVGEDLDAADAHPDLIRMFREAKGLTSSDRQILDEIISSFLKRRQQENDGN